MSFSKQDYKDVVGDAAFDNDHAAASGYSAGGGSSDDEFIATGRDRELSDDYYAIYQSLRGYCSSNSLFLLENMTMHSLVQYLRHT